MTDTDEPNAPGKSPARRRPSMPSDGEAKPERRAGGRRQVDDAFEDLLDTFTAHLDKVKYLDFHSQDTYAGWSRDYYRWLVAAEPELGLTDASPATIRAFVSFKRKTVKPATIGTILHSLRSFYDFLLLDDPTRPNPAKSVKGPRIIAAPIDPFSEDEVRQILGFAQHYEHSEDLRRWVGYVILVIFASTGVRNAELRELRTENVNLSRRELRVIGKGSKERIIPFGAGAAEVLSTYVEQLRPRLAPSPYFIVNPASLHGQNSGRMGESALADLVDVLLTDAGISGRKNPHRFRHSYATLTISKTGNMELTKDQLGHANVTTTSIYLHTTMQDRHDAADRVDLVPRSEATEPIPAVSPSPPPTVAIEPGDTEDHSVELLPPEHRAPTQPLVSGHLVQGDPVATQTNLQDRADEQLGEAVEIARLLPKRLLVRLNSERLVEVALGSCVTTGLNTDVFLAAAGAVLSWAHGLPLPLAPLLATHGTDVVPALSEVRTTLELLSDLDPSRR
ncbi:MAG: tyrosine-type recombinase/integrase [Acidimicrobiales bacterium]